MQCTLSGRKEAQLAVARFLAVSAARNDTAYRVDATDANTCVRELRPESFGKRSVNWDAKQIPARCSDRTPQRGVPTLAITFVIFIIGLARTAYAIEVLEEKVEQKYVLDPTATLNVSNTDGSIQVYGSDRSEISIQAIKRAYTEERLKGIAVDVKATPESVAIETIMPPRKGGLSLRDRSGTVEYIVTVPQTVRITKLELVNGEILVKGLRGGSARAHLVNGLLTAHNCFGDLDFSIVNGRLEVVYDWWDNRKFSVKASSENASIRAILPSDTSAAIAARAPAGWIVNGFDVKKAGPAERAHALNFAIGTEAAAVFEMTAANGNIRIDKTY